MSTRDIAVSVLSNLSEQKMLEFIRLFADESTLARMEAEMLLNDPDAKRYSSFDEILKEIEEDDE